MNRTFNRSSYVRIAAPALILLASLFAFSPNSYAASPAVQIRLDVSKAGPRAVEPLTERAVLRDYRFAWTSMAEALQSNSFDPLAGPFAGEAKKWLSETVANQQRSGLTQQYIDQNHHVEAVFYAPEGDVMELHDIAEYQLQISAGGKLIHDEHVVLHFVVLMTPASDRWVIRQLQAVPQF